jgi:hypothetical protein
MDGPFQPIQHPGGIDGEYPALVNHHLGQHLACSAAKENQALAPLVVVHHLLMVLGPLCYAKKASSALGSSFDQTLVILVIEQVGRGDFLLVLA